MCNRLDTIPACDRRTDRRTDILPRHSPRYAYASRGKNQDFLRKKVILFHDAQFLKSVSFSLSNLSRSNIGQDADSEKHRYELIDGKVISICTENVFLLIGRRMRRSREWKARRDCCVVLLVGCARCLARATAAVSVSFSSSWASSSPCSIRPSLFSVPSR